LPIYEYECQDCKNKFTVFLSVNEMQKQEKEGAIECPKCHSKNVKKLITVPSAVIIK